MLKKTLSVIIAVVMLLSVAIIPTSAASDDIIIDKEVLDTVVESAVAELVGADKNAEIIVDKALTNEIAKDAGPVITAKEASSSISNFIFINPADVSGLSDTIANDSVYTVKVLSNGKSTVYIAVNIEERPEIMNFDVFRETVKKLGTKQNDYAGADFDLMSYEHIAGELALHAMVYALAKLTNQTSEGSPLYSFYLSAKVADLNIDENRFPLEAIKAIGTVIMDYFYITIYTIYSLFA